MDNVKNDNYFIDKIKKDNLASQKCMLANGAYKAGEDEEHYFMRIPKL